MRQFQHDYLVASGYTYEYLAATEKSHATHRYVQGNQVIRIHDNEENWFYQMIQHDGLDMHVNTISNTRCFDNILDYAMFLHSIGAVNLKSNLRKVYECDGKRPEFNF
jgi:hypothetical protein